MAVEGRDFYSLSYRYSGKISIKYENTELISECGSVTFMPRGVAYETEILEDTSMAIIHFRLAEDIDFRNPAVLAVSDKSIRHLFDRLVREYRVDEPFDFSCMALFYELLSRLETYSASESVGRIPDKLRRAKEYMLESFSDSALSISSVADEVGVSTAYLRREFSACYGKSPIACLRDVRIENAKRLLQSEYLTVEQIAEECGFSGASYFIQVFHKATGTSPDKYRR